jgi:hypothetical protein
MLETAEEAVASIKANTHDYAWGTYIVVCLLISLGRMRKRRHPPSTANPRRTQSGRGCYQLGPMQKRVQTLLPCSIHADAFSAQIWATFASRRPARSLCARLLGGGHTQILIALHLFPSSQRKCPNSRHKKCPCMSVPGHEIGCPASFVRWVGVAPPARRMLFSPTYFVHINHYFHSSRTENMKLKRVKHGLQILTLIYIVLKLLAFLEASSSPLLSRGE